MSSFTKNPERKLLKKQRQSHARGDKDQALKVQGEINLFYRRQVANEKNKKKRELKMNEKKMTDDEFMNQFQKENKKLFKVKQAKEKNEGYQKKLSLEKDKKRAKILLKKEMKKEQEMENKKHLEEENKKYKEAEALTNERLKDHEAKLKVEKPDMIDELEESLLKKTKNNKKKTKKLLKKTIQQKAMFLEMIIQGYMDEHKVSYEEAEKKVSEMMNQKESVPNNVESLQDMANCAKL